jgi:hypothetical protein
MRTRTPRRGYVGLGLQAPQIVIVIDMITIRIRDRREAA